MNDEQKYQVYLSNGGEATYEEFLSVSSMMQPDQLDELIGLKKKDQSDNSH